MFGRRRFSERADGFGETLRLLAQLDRSGAAFFGVRGDGLRHLVDLFDGDGDLLHALPLLRRGGGNLSHYTADAVGLTMDGSGFGMGKRGQRFAMVVKDGVVDKLFVEEPGDFKVSSADYMLEQL